MHARGPGQVDTVIPESRTVAVRQQDTVESPAFALRQLWWPGETPDDQARAWINGQSLPVLSRGEAPIGSGWEFDATDAVVFGAANVVVVEVTNSSRELHEIGTGGITGPAMLWAVAR